MIDFTNWIFRSMFKNNNISRKKSSSKEIGPIVYHRGLRKTDLFIFYEYIYPDVEKHYTLLSREDFNLKEYIARFRIN